MRYAMAAVQLPSPVIAMPDPMTGQPMALRSGEDHHVNQTKGQSPLYWTTAEVDVWLKTLYARRGLNRDDLDNYVVQREVDPTHSLSGRNMWNMSVEDFGAFFGKSSQAVFEGFLSQLQQYNGTGFDYVRYFRQQLRKQLENRQLRAVAKHLSLAPERSPSLGRPPRPPSCQLARQCEFNALSISDFTAPRAGHVLASNQNAHGLPAYRVDCKQNAFTFPNQNLQPCVTSQQQTVCHAGNMNAGACNLAPSLHSAYPALASAQPNYVPLVTDEPWACQPTASASAPQLQRSHSLRSPLSCQPGQATNLQLQQSASDTMLDMYDCSLVSPLATPMPQTESFQNPNFSESSESIHSAFASSQRFTAQHSFRLPSSPSSMSDNSDRRTIASSAALSHSSDQMSSLQHMTSLQSTFNDVSDCFSSLSSESQTSPTPSVASTSLLGSSYSDVSAAWSSSSSILDSACSLMPADLHFEPRHLEKSRYFSTPGVNVACCDVTSAAARAHCNKGATALPEAGGFQMPLKPVYAMTMAQVTSNPGTSTAGSQRHRVEQRFKKHELSRHRKRRPPLPPSLKFSPDNNPVLFEFLLELLYNPATYKHLIHWINESQGLFRLQDTESVAALWGIQRKKPSMNYDKMSRALRYYHNEKASLFIMEKVKSVRRVYRFLPASNWLTYSPKNVGYDFTFAGDTTLSKNGRLSRQVK